MMVDWYRIPDSLMESARGSWTRADAAGGRSETHLGAEIRGQVGGQDLVGEGWNSVVRRTAIPGGMTAWAKWLAASPKWGSTLTPVTRPDESDARLNWEAPRHGCAEMPAPSSHLVCRVTGS